MRLSRADSRNGRKGETATENGRVSVRLLESARQTDRAFDYLIPEDMHISPGAIVTVPFGRQNRLVSAVADRVYYPGGAPDAFGWTEAGRRSGCGRCGIRRGKTEECGAVRRGSRPPRRRRRRRDLRRRRYRRRRAAAQIRRLRDKFRIAHTGVSLACAFHARTHALHLRRCGKDHAPVGGAVEHIRNLLRG